MSDETFTVGHANTAETVAKMREVAGALAILGWPEMARTLARWATCVEENAARGTAEEADGKPVVLAPTDRDGKPVLVESHHAAEAWSEVKRLEEVERDLKQKLALVSTESEGVWLWQGDGGNEPASLSCPVVMSADTLRAMLARATMLEERAAAERALRQAERDLAIRMTDRGICGYLALDDACQDARRKLSALGGEP